MDEKSDVLINDINSDSLGLKKKALPWKKIIIFGSIAIAAIILIIVLIILLSKNSSDNPSEEKISVGNIYCIYDISSDNAETNILGNEFNKLSNFDIYINGKIIKYSKVHKFDKIGANTVEFKLYENINMDNMFKDVSSLISVEIK